MKIFILLGSLILLHPNFVFAQENLADRNACEIHQNFLVELAKKQFLDIVYEKTTFNIYIRNIIYGTISTKDQVQLEKPQVAEIHQYDESSVIISTNSSGKINGNEGIINFDVDAKFILKDSVFDGKEIHLNNIIVKRVNKYDPYGSYLGTELHCQLAATDGFNLHAYESETKKTILLFDLQTSIVSITLP